MTRRQGEAVRWPILTLWDLVEQGLDSETRADLQPFYLKPQGGFLGLLRAIQVTGAVPGPCELSWVNSTPTAAVTM